MIDKGKYCFCNLYNTNIDMPRLNIGIFIMAPCISHGVCGMNEWSMSSCSSFEEEGDSSIIVEVDGGLSDG